MKTLFKIVLGLIILSSCTKIEYIDPTQTSIDSLKTLIDNSKQAAKAKPVISTVVRIDTITVRDTILIIRTDTIHIIQTDTITKTNTVTRIDTVYVTALAITLTDIDGNVYNTVKIGTQVWMKENLKTTKYNDGTPIPLATDTSSVHNFTDPYYYTVNKRDGNYYNWYSVNTDKICPTGWHVSSGKEWTTLTDYLGGNAGVKLMDETGFTALLSGTIFWRGGLTEQVVLYQWTVNPNWNSEAQWWTYEVKPGISPFTFNLGMDGNCGVSDFPLTGNMQTAGLTVRCLKN